MSTDTLKTKWKALLEAEELTTIKDNHRKEVTAVLLENTEKELHKAAEVSHGGFQTLSEAPVNATGGFPANPNLQGYDPVLISLVRRSMPNLMAFDVAGVQPMSAPTGLIFALRSKYANQAGTEALFDEANTSFSSDATPAHAGTDPLDPAFETGQGLSTTEGESLGDGTAPEFAEMAFSIDKVSVTAKTRALKAEYTMELQQDLRAVHGLDAEAELANILASEILAEINREVVRTIYTNSSIGAASATLPGTFDLALDTGGRWEKERWLGLLYQIETEANAIAKATRRGRGNTIICSSDVASALSIAGHLDVAPALKRDLNVDDTGNTFAGVLNGRFKVFVDPYASSNYMVVGYKGANKFDAGLFYCPYVPLQMVRAVGENTFQPKLGFKSRYGMVSNPFANAAGDGSLTRDANVYYRKFRISNLLG